MGTLKGLLNFLVLEVVSEVCLMPQHFPETDNEGQGNGASCLSYLRKLFPSLKVLWAPRLYGSDERVNCSGPGDTRGENE